MIWSLQYGPYGTVDMMNYISYFKQHIRLPSKPSTANEDWLADLIVKKKASDEQKKAVWDFEPIANKSQWCTFNFSSGSTGKPKIQIYKNQVAMKLLANDNTGMKDVVGLRRGL